MWYPPKVIGDVTVEPVVIDDARRQCRIGPTDTNFNAELTRLIQVARDHVEKYCGMNFAERPVTIECTWWEDFAALPLAPLKSVTSVKYTDEAGELQTVPNTVYEIAGSRFSPSLSLKAGQEWPAAFEHGANIELVAVFGGSVPPTVQHAMLLLIGHLFNVREAVTVGNTVTVPMAFDDLLTNDRRGIYS